MEPVMKPNNSVKVTIKKSSNSGKIGYDIDVIADGFLDQKALDGIAEMAMNTALKTRKVVEENL